MKQNIVWPLFIVGLIIMVISVAAPWRFRKPNPATAPVVVSVTVIPEISMTITWDQDVTLGSGAFGCDVTADDADFVYFTGGATVLGPASNQTTTPLAIEDTGEGTFTCSFTNNNDPMNPGVIGVNGGLLAVDFSNFPFTE